MPPPGSPAPSPGALLQVAAVVAAGTAFGAWAGRRFARYEVAGESMAPAYRGGDWLVADRRAYRRRLPRPGEVVVVRDPDDATRTLVKRVRHTDLHGRVWLEGDNRDHSRDSRTFGALPAALVAGRVVFRYWPLSR